MKRGPKPKDYGVCAVCGKPLNKDQGKYCSRACMWEYQRKIRAEASEAKRRRVCETCGKTFIMHWQSGKANRGEVKEGRFCSRKCRGESQRKPGKPAKKTIWRCRICGKEMSAYAVYCSDECRKKKARDDYYANHRHNLELARLRHLRTWQQREPFECKECGKIHQPAYGDTSSVFCSPKCAARYQRRWRDNKKRAEANGVYYEYVNPLKVFKRDGWRCQLCGKKLNPKHRGKIRDDAPELDHIIPWAKGGEHSYRNTQCACRKCNMEKGARELGQLRLFG